jgi:hypothetical protein
LNPRWLMIGDGEMSLVSKELNVRLEAVSTENELQSLANELIPKNDSFESKGLFFGREDLINHSNSNPNQPTITENRLSSALSQKISPQAIEDDTRNGKTTSNQTASFPVVLEGMQEIEQILFFYKDKTFTIYKPS